MTVPDIGPIIASATVAAISNGAPFTKGRATLPHGSAWCRSSLSTGARTVLGRISKRGNRYLRTLLSRLIGSFLLRPVNWLKHSFGSWLTAATQRLHHNVLTTALASKLAGIAWSVLSEWSWT
jgi:transposase